MIEAKATTYIGITFSRLCEIKHDENNEAYSVIFKYPELESKVKASFEDREIHPSEVTPELISLILGLEFEPIQDRHDAIIGIHIRDIDIGTQNVSCCYPKVSHSAFNQVRNQLKPIIGEEDCHDFIMLYLIGSVHTSTELTKIEE